MRTGSITNGVWVEEFDTDTGTYTRRAPDGTVLAQRPLTAAEAAELSALDNEARIRASLAGSAQFNALRQIATDTGVFATNAARDAAIRTCARAIVALVRLAVQRLDAPD